ncbi:MAG TPA: RpiB/LacA/LacB family sugar-phosphate isomerase, partial [Bdellovibrionota bacterium]|nr:RpiB/LacA/LacB family sugar-phosphate isomerase [Bdellovibrionota bacterium]
MAANSIAIASDHAGFHLKESLQSLLPEVKWHDLGPETAERVDYPDYAEDVAREVAGGMAPLGVLICGSGIGMSIAANKIHGIR